MEETRVLMNNKVSHFILRIDVDPLHALIRNCLICQ